jgi:hypothetical protein
MQHPPGGRCLMMALSFGSMTSVSSGEAYFLFFEKRALRGAGIDVVFAVGLIPFINTDSTVSDGDVLKRINIRRKKMHKRPCCKSSHLLP